MHFMFPKTPLPLSICSESQIFIGVWFSLVSEKGFNYYTELPNDISLGNNANDVSAYHVLYNSKFNGLMAIKWQTKIKSNNACLS